MAASKKTGGLAGVTAGETHLCTVGKEGAGLTYRGYDIYDLVDNACFEEVAYLLLHGHLPTRAELDAYVARIKANRGLPDALKTVLEMIPADAHPMDVLRTGVSFLGNVEPEGDFSNQNDVADRLLACLPSMLLYWHRFHADGVRIDTETDDDSISGHFLHLLHDKAPKELHRKMSRSTTLILYAEHEFNASTFAGRVITGTLSDMHSVVAGAIGALRGPLHGGANEAAMELISKFDTPEEATAGVHGHAGTQRPDHGFRSPGVHDLGSAQRRQQDGCRRRWPRTSATPCCTRCPRRSKKSCGTRRSCSPTPTSLPPASTTSWVFRPTCSRRSSFARVSPGGRRTSWNSAPTTS